MKILRSTKHSLRFTTQAKSTLLQSVLTEYGKVVNIFIEHFWEHGLPKKKKAGLLKPVVDLPTTWFTARLRKVAAREAIDMIEASKKRDGDKAKKPTHRGTRMCLSSTIAELRAPVFATEFDHWLHLASIGNGIVLDIPIRLHKRYLRWAECGKRLASYVITKDYVQLCFEIETGPKPTDGLALGIDSGIKTLASTSDRRALGTDIEPFIARKNRCRWGSKGHKRAQRALQQRIHEVVRDTINHVQEQGVSCVVVEDLKNLKYKTKLRRRLSKSMRRTLGAWTYRTWLGRLRMVADANRVCFRTVPPAYTSQRCHACGHTERGNRSGVEFKCRECGHSDNADFNAALNIVERFTSGPYGAGFKPLIIGHETGVH